MFLVNYNDLTATSLESLISIVTENHVHMTLFQLSELFQLTQYSDRYTEHAIAML